MAHTQLDGRPPLKAASAMKAYVPLMFLPAGSSLTETVFAAGSVNDMPFGIVAASVASPGDPVTYWRHGDVAKGIAGASLGAGAVVAIGSTNGILIPVPPSGLSTALGSALGAQGIRWSVGIAMQNRAAGDFVSVFVKPDEII